MAHEALKRGARLQIVVLLCEMVLALSAAAVAAAPEDSSFVRQSVAAVEVRTTDTSSPSRLTPPGITVEKAQCEALAQSDFRQLRDAPTRVASSRYVNAVEKSVSYCEVHATIFPKIGIALQLPATKWNGKLLELGCGGFCGTVDLEGCAEPLQRGYACVVSDMGHEDTGSANHWADYNMQALFDFANRAPHAALLAARAIVAGYYPQKMRRAYFMGCSTGGYLGMIEAQRFPWDFDGIIAGDPDMDEADLLMRELWVWRALRDADAKPLLQPADLHLLHQAALAACDMSDGVRDGIVGDPVGCPFRGGNLLCKRGQTSGCLTATQMAAVQRVYDGPTDSAGHPTSTRGPFPGSELYWLPDPPLDPAPNPVDVGHYNVYVPSPGQHWIEGDFNFDQDYKRLGLGALYNDTNPDLRKFRAAGGKLLVYQGGNDVVELAAVYDYYEMVEKVMDGRVATQAFVRLFTVPGMTHCGGGEGADQIDYLTYLEDWVERGRPPDKMIGTHSENGKVFSRPVFPYPKYARYIGSGDVNDARNFVPVSPRAR